MSKPTPNPMDTQPKPKRLPTLSEMEATGTKDIDEAFAQAIHSLGEGITKADVLTELDKNEIFVFSILTALNVELDSEGIKEFIEKFLRLRISHKRKGRAELVNVAKAVGMAGQEQRIGLLQRIRNAF